MPAYCWRYAADLAFLLLASPLSRAAQPVQQPIVPLYEIHLRFSQLAHLPAEQFSRLAMQQQLQLQIIRQL